VRFAESAMSKSVTKIPDHVEKLLAYLKAPSEKADEDLALSYFRKVFGEKFTRQKEAKLADGYLPSSFVLELKPETNGWLAGLFQGLAYKNQGLDFSQVIVAAHNFLAVWRVDNLPESLREEIATEAAAPNQVGKQYAAKYASKRAEILKLATWSGADLLTPLFQAAPDLTIQKIHEFEKTVRQGRKVRRRITVNNLTTVLKEMKSFFDTPIKAVRAFYAIIYDWAEDSVLHLSQKAQDQATVSGALVTGLKPGTRARFKEFIEGHYIVKHSHNGYEEYFSRYDEALDAVDKDFRSGRPEFLAASRRFSVAAFYEIYLVNKTAYLPGDP
jgi:hypothetical protein